MKKINEVQQEISNLTNCIECVREDGCYTCRKNKPNHKNIKEMLIEFSARNRELTEVSNSYKKIANDMVNGDSDDYGDFAIDIMNLDKRLEKLFEGVE